MLEINTHTKNQRTQSPESMQIRQGHFQITTISHQIKVTQHNL